MKRFKLGWKLHVALLLAMAAIVVLVIVKLDAWNKRTVVIDKNIDPTAYETESYDLSFHVDQSILDAREDDGVNKMLVIGNYGAIRPSDAGKSVLDRIKDKMPDWQIDSVCAYYSMVTCPSFIADGDYPGGHYWSPYSLYYIVKSMINKEYDVQEWNLYENGAIEKSGADEWLANFESIDIETYDTVLIMYASADYYQNQILYNPDNDYDVCSYVGSLRSTITMLKEKYPYIRIVVSSPYLTYSTWGDERCLGTLTNFGNGTEAEYVTREYDVCTQYCVSFIDNYFNYITEKNYEEYINDKGLNDKGVEAVSDHIVEFLAD
ncbi:MAG: hypothetical protein MJ123_00110 [Lachnospiraceae bacterium]|nr:hypothetical protein [Lachnospiraceae bacterium]